MDKKLKISIIIPVHNQFNLLDECLKSIDKCTEREKFDYEIILSDSDSDKKLKEYYELLHLRESSFSDKIKIVMDDTNPGFSRAVNNGMKLACNDSDYYIWLNSDTIVTKGWLRDIDFYDLCSPISNNASYQTVLQIDKIDIGVVEKFTDYTYKLKYSQSFKDLRTTFLNGFCYMISNKVFKHVGFLDEIHFPHYGSEDDYSLRSILLGYKPYILANNFVFHHGNQSYQSEKTSELRQNTKVFLSRYPKDWFDKLIFKHKILTRELRLSIIERFIDYVG